MASTSPNPSMGRHRSRFVLVSISIALMIIASIAILTSLYIPPSTQKTQTPGGVGSGGLIGFSNLRSFSSYEEIWGLLSSLEEAYGYPYAADAIRAVITPTASQGGSPAPVPPASFSTTNVQVVGVDELDIVKTDGRLIVVASGGRAFIVDPQGLRILASISIDGYIHGVFLWGDRLAVIAREDRVAIEPLPIPRVSVIAPPIRMAGNTSIYIYDISTPSRPSEIARIVYTGYISGARMINGTVYLVISMPAIVNTTPSVNGVPIDPGLVFQVDPMPSSFVTIASIDLSRGGHREFSLLMSYSSWIYMSASRLYVVSINPAYYKAMARALEILAGYMPSNISSQVLELVGRGAYYKALGLVSKYLSTLDLSEAQAIVSNASQKLSTEVFRDTSRIHVIDVRDLETMYRGYIEVPGSILDQFSIEEYKEHLVVATTSTNLNASIMASYARVETKSTAVNATVTIIECIAGSNRTTRTMVIPTTREMIRLPPSPIPFIYIGTNPQGESVNNVYIASLADRKIVGILEGLAEGERIYAARLVGDIFYLVTFRQIDPLYAIDISNPEKPEILGYIKIPGFSEYLHPLARETLLGIGIENNSLKISLFNTKDPRNIVETAVLKIENAWSQALGDHHAVTINLERGLLLIPITTRMISKDGILSGIAVISIENNKLELKAILSHEGASRSIYIGDTIYTISHESIKTYNIDTLQETGKIDLK
ncbi:MAG: beta-propeller domain-containing protein [Sulfolobales archaeon]